jgi:hypothetical protein
LRFTRALSAVLIAAMLAACSGGTGTSGFTPGNSGTSTPQKQRIGHIRATLHVPGKKKHQSPRTAAYMKAQIAKHWHPMGSRKPKYLSGATTELDFNLNTNNGVAATPTDQTAFDFSIYTDSSNCTGDANNGYQCTIVAPAPVGTDTYNVLAQQCSVSGSSSTASCASLGGTLTVLSASYVTVAIPLNETVPAAFTLSPVVASIDWAPVTYANLQGPTAMANGLWFTQPNGTNIPTYDPVNNVYSCGSTADARRAHNVKQPNGNGCYEPIAQSVPVAYGVVLEARDPNGSLIVGASGDSTVYQTPVYVDPSGNAVSISWSCFDAATSVTVQNRHRGEHPHNVLPRPIELETGGGPFSPGIVGTPANQAFNSPVLNPSVDPDGGNTTDGNGNPVTAVGNNGTEINWDGSDQPVLNTPDYCSATTSSGLSTSLDFYLGLGQGGITVPTPTPSPTPTPEPTSPPDGTVYSVSANLLEWSAGSYGSPSATLTNLPWTGSTASNSSAKISFDSAGDVYFLYQTGTGGTPVEIAEYAAGATGTDAPIRTFSTANTLAAPTSMAIDTQGNIYLADNGANAIYVYGAAASGTASPIRTISGGATQLSFPFKIGFDNAGNLWALNNSDIQSTDQSVLAEFAPGANGNVAPTMTYGGSTLHTACPSTRSPSSMATFAFNAEGDLIILGEWGSPEGEVYETMAGFGSTTCPSYSYTIVNPYANSNNIATDDQGYVYINNVYPDMNSFRQGSNIIGIYPDPEWVGTTPDDCPCANATAPSVTIANPAEGDALLGVWSNPNLWSSSSRHHAHRVKGKPQARV